MVRGLLLWAAGNAPLEGTVTENSILSRATHRFIAEERLEEALEAAAELNAHGIGGILDLLGEGLTDLEGANKAVEQYLEAAEAIAARGLDATISIKLSQLAQIVDRNACVVSLGRILDRAEAVAVPVEIDMEDSSLVSDTLEHYREAAAWHPQARVFTGSTMVFGHLWGAVATNLKTSRAYPRLVGETGRKDFVVAHPSADIDFLRVALVSGVFEYQGQKCSTASRAYIPQSLWSKLRSDLVSEIDSLGDVTDFSNFMGAVTDDRSFNKLSGVIDRVRGKEGVEILAGGKADDGEGYFDRPTVVQADDPEHEVFTTEYFGPILGVFVYDDADYDRVLRESAAIGPYGLTGSIIAQDRTAIVEAMDVLGFAAGNFYINDKPTGAVAGQQPFGGARASGTNDKAGSILNLLRWVSPRTIKETFVPPTDYRYPDVG